VRRTWATRGGSAAAWRARREGGRAEATEQVVPRSHGGQRQGELDAEEVGRGRQAVGAIAVQSRAFQARGKPTTALCATRVHGPLTPTASNGRGSAAVLGLKVVWCRRPASRPWLRHCCLRHTRSRSKELDGSAPLPGVGQRLPGRAAPAPTSTARQGHGPAGSGASEHTHPDRSQERRYRCRCET
jgi:hypothetical protein